MERTRKLWQREQDYEPIQGSSAAEEEERQELRESTSFSWIEYSIFLLLGVAMLWAWNMLLAAGPYFQSRFASSARLLDNFQASELAVSSITNLGSMLVLTNMQAHASYPRRIVMSLLINLVAFALLALSTWFVLGISASTYFAFLILIVFATSLAAGLCQNGVFAFVSGFGQPRYTQAIMTGQGVAGVLPCIAQIVSVLSVGKSQSHQGPSDEPEGPTPVPGTAAFAYFITATVICAATLVAFFFLVRQYNSKKDATAQEDMISSLDSVEQRRRKTVPLAVLFGKLRWLAAAVFSTFTITMMFPIYTQRILSVRSADTQSRLLQAPCFIPLAFFFWNSGDLLGRLLPAVPRLSLIHRPKLIFSLSIARIVFIPLYHLCNIRGQGAVVNSDVFYLLVVQLLFGVSNGYLGSMCMMGAGEWVDAEEREASGGFMGLCLVAGLAFGSLISFFAAKA
jgi:equilibrative nucleoside transporter 1/2/3